MLTKYILLLLLLINCNSNHIPTNNIKLLVDKKNNFNLVLKNESSVIKKLSRTIEIEYNK
jgi:hypothetical protein